MRTFTDSGDKLWRVRVDGAAAPRGGNGIGWQALIFESATEKTQRILYRPVGWLDQASDAELRAALTEGETVRAHWTPEQ
jgi:hypothetical protein